METFVNKWLIKGFLGPCFVHRARPLNCPGSDLKGVKLLQSYEDAKEIHNSSLGQKAVVIGASFIGNQI